MILTTYQEQESLHDKPNLNGTVAIVERVFQDGLTLFFDGELVASKKRYPCNQAMSYYTGCRVFLVPNGDSYVVAFPI